MLYQTIKPWGIRPTPLIPQSIIEDIGDYPAPHSFQRVLGEGAKIRDLGKDIWSRVDDVTDDQKSDLLSFLNTHKTKFLSRDICLELPVKISLLDLPFSTRTRNIVYSFLDYFQTNSFLTYRRVIDDLPNFGIKSAIEFSCIVESANSCEQFLDPIAELDVQLNINDVGWERIISFYKLFSAWALGERQLHDFTELLPPPMDDWPEEFKSSWNQLRTLKTQELAGNLVELYSVPSLIENFFTQIDKRLDQLLINRIFTVEHKITLSDIGNSLGVSRERVRQLEANLFIVLEKVHGDEYSPVLRRAEKLRNSLGSALPFNRQILKDTVDEFTADISIDDRDNVLVQSFLLWLAGPYKVYTDWLLTDEFLPARSIEELKNSCDDRGLVQFEVLREVLKKLGIKEDFHEHWVNHLKTCTWVDDGIIFTSGSIPDKAESLIRYYDRPMTADEIIESLGGSSVKSVRNRLMTDDRFWRINKNNEFVLAGTEGYGEYSSITKNILEELEMHGGSASVEYIVEKLVTTYKVKRNSVIAYLNTPIFTIDSNNHVRRAKLDETTVKVGEIRKTPSCYRTVDGFWCLRIKLDGDYLRGSGRVIPKSFAKELDCNPGDRILLETEFVPVTLTWSLSSVQGATIGSLRSIIESLQGGIGDYVFIIASEPCISFKLLKLSELERTASRVCRLSLMVGGECNKNEEIAVANIATALEIPTSLNERMILTEARNVLSLRGENKLASLIPVEKMSFDNYLI